MQHEITHSAPLLNESGSLREPGYAKRLLPIYRRADIRAGKSRIKEWDYYLITDGHIGLASLPAAATTWRSAMWGTHGC